MGGDKKGPPTSFCSVTSANVGISARNFLTFSFNPLAILVQSSLFWSNPCIFEIMMKIPESPNFGHLTTYTI